MNTNFIKKILQKKIVRFFLVSGLNTAFGYGLFSSLILIGLHYTIAGLISTILGILFNFKTIGLVVFKNKKNDLIFKFFGVYGINYIISIALLTLFESSGMDTFLSLKLFTFTNLLFFKNPRINACIGGAILVIPMGLFAYVLNHFFVFNNTYSHFAKFKKEIN